MVNRTRAALAIVASAGLLSGVMLAMAPAGTAANSVADTRNIVTNPNFASPALTTSFFTVDSTSSGMPGWTVPSGDVDLISPSFWQEPAGDPAGTQSVDLDGRVPGVLTQTLTTVPGVTYTGSVEVAANTGGAHGVRTATLSVGNTTLNLSSDPTGFSPTNMDWQQVDFSFVASSTATPLTFTSTFPGANGLAITDVIVDPPLPPVISGAPNLTVYQTTPAGAPVFYSPPQASDPNVSGPSFLQVSCSTPPGAVFPVGTTTVTCSATEPEGLTSSTSFTVTVLKIVSSCHGLPLNDKGYLQAHPNYGANAPTTPCVADPNYTSIGVGPLVLIPGIPLLHVNPVAVNVAVLHGVTDYAATQGVVSASSNATLASATITAPGLTLEAHALYSQASATLSGGVCGGEITTGESSIAALKINGKNIVVGTAPLTIKLGIVNIYVNQTVRVGNTITQRALYVDVLHGSTFITVGESEAGVACG